MSKKERRNMLRDIQELEFSCVELNLYLDNHPDCERALADYNMYTEKLINLKNIFEMKYGPLANFGSSPSRFPWQWVEEPWPWEDE